MTPIGAEWVDPKYTSWERISSRRQRAKSWSTRNDTVDRHDRDDNHPFAIATNNNNATHTGTIANPIDNQDRWVGSKKKVDTGGGQIHGCNVWCE